MRTAANDNRQQIHLPDGILLSLDGHSNDPIGNAGQVERRFLTEPEVGYVLAFKGSDGGKYFAAVLVDVGRDREDGETYYNREGWHVEWYGSRDAAARVVRKSYKAVDRIEDDGFERDDFECEAAA